MPGDVYRVYGPDACLTDEAIIWLARKTWWGEPGPQTGISVDTSDPLCWVKRRPLCWWWDARSWPACWPWGAWVALGDRLQLRLVVRADGPYVEVRRPRR